MHRAGVVHRIAESGGAERSGKRWEQMRGRAFVIPDVGAVAEAAAVMVVDAFEPVELAVGGAETGGAGERREIGAGRLLYDGGEGTLAKGLREQEGSTFEALKIRCRIFGGGERGGESGAIVISDDGFAKALWSRPAAPFRRAVRKAPGEQKGEAG